MKKILTTTLLAMFWICMNAQTPDWLWVKSAGGTGIDEGNDISSDANGNVYVSGCFDSPTITFGTTTLTNAGNLDIYIVKYDSSGNVLWAKSAGGNRGEGVFGISTDASGNVYLTGLYTSLTLAFDSITLTNAGSSNLFVVKYNPLGNVLWAKSAGGTEQDRATAINIDANGNLYITGQFTSPSITFGNYTLVNRGPRTQDYFIVKYDASGKALWAKSAGGQSPVFSRDISTDAYGNVFVTGEFLSSTITFGTTTLTSKGSYDIFLVKYDSSGNVQWAKSTGGKKSNDAGFAISTDSKGNAYLTGCYDDSSITFGSTTLHSDGSVDFYIVKYDALGNVLWAKSAGGTGLDMGMGIVTNNYGNQAISGRFNSPSLTFGTTTLTCKGDHDIFIVEYDSSGNVLWAKSAGGNGLDEGICITTDKKGNIYVSGIFSTSSATFDTTTLLSKGSYDIYLGKITSDKTNSIIDIHQNDNQINIYPVPGNGKFTINSNSAISYIEVYNLTGNLLYSDYNLNKQTSNEIDLSDFQKGIYLARIFDGKQVITEKVIIQ
jgi:hypothetical protein